MSPTKRQTCPIPPPSPRCHPSLTMPPLSPCCHPSLSPHHYASVNATPHHYSLLAIRLRKIVPDPPFHQIVIALHRFQIHSPSHIPPAQLPLSTTHVPRRRLSFSLISSNTCRKPSSLLFLSFPFFSSFFSSTSFSPDHANVTPHHTSSLLIMSGRR